MSGTWVERLRDRLPLRERDIARALADLSDFNVRASAAFTELRADRDALKATVESLQAKLADLSAPRAEQPKKSTRAAP